MKLEDALKQNPYDKTRGSKGAYIRYLRYTVDGWYSKKSEEIRKQIDWDMLGIAVIDANQIKRHLEYEEKRQERAASDYAKLHSCEFCKGSKLYSCTGYDCREPYRRAYEYALSRIRERQET